MIKVVAFDLDDTLWEVDPVLIEAERILAAWLEDAVPGVGYHRTSVGEVRQEVAAHHPDLVGRPTDFRHQVIASMLRRFGLSDSESDATASAAMVVFLEARSRLVLFDDVQETIAELATRFTLGALTNGNADITRVGLDEWFDFAFSAEDVGAPKPEPALFLAALEHTGADPAEMIYVGDHPRHDIDAANRVGLVTIWVDNKIKRREPGDTKPDAVVTHVRELPSAIDGLIRARRQPR